MKKLFVLAAFVSLMSSGAFAAQLESINVKDVVARGNLMPGPGRPTGNRVQMTITFDAMSTGCTDENSFTATLTQGRAAQTLVINRTSPDLCEAFPHKKEIEILVPGYRVGFPMVIKNPAIVTEQIAY
jgi:hypothetical protein